MSVGSDRIASVPGPVVGEDGLARCPWGDGDAVMRAYHDTEWGVPVTRRGGPPRAADAGGVPVRAVLADDPAQATGVPRGVRRLRRRPGRGVRRARRGPADGRRRHRPQPRQGQRRDHQRPGHGRAARRTAAWPPSSSRTAPSGPLCARARPTTCRAKTAESLALSKALKKAGFVFVGPTTMYALMEAIGIVDDHLAGCHRHGSATAVTYQPTTWRLLNGAQGRRRLCVIPCGAPPAHHRRPPAPTGGRHHVGRDRTCGRRSPRQRLASRSWLASTPSPTTLSATSTRSGSPRPWPRAGCRSPR